jgi:hypothetical protein
MMPFVAIACAALTVVTLLAVPHAAKGRRLARLFRTQQVWAEQMDRGAARS